MPINAQPTGRVTAAPAPFLRLILERKFILADNDDRRDKRLR